jgi:hypothetical protein
VTPDPRRDLPPVDAAPDPLSRGPHSLIDVLDRVLDAGITVEPWVRASLASLDLAGGEARITVASVETHLAYEVPPPTDGAAPATHENARADDGGRREQHDLKRAIERLDA